jgi:hypothetical protein
LGTFERKLPLQEQIDNQAYKIGGRKRTRVRYTDVYALGFVYKNIAIYVPREEGLYKFFLTNRECDSHGPCGCKKSADEVLRFGLRELGAECRGHHA